MQQVWYRDLGTIDYQSAWSYQEKLMQLNIAQKALLHTPVPADGELATEIAPVTENHLLLLEHPPVYTLGKSGKPAHILIGRDEMTARNIAFFNTNRGGDVTFHGPGQLVGYPVLDLEKFTRDIGKYLRNLEEVVIRTIAEYGLKGDRSPGETGVWLEPDLPGAERKICAMGVRCSRWITMHGFALNINTDLDYFSHIVPCGITNKKVTSVREELGRAVPVQEVKEFVKKHFEHVFGARLEEHLTPLTIR